MPQTENMAEKYKFLQHTADAKFQAFGKTLGEAFANAALAMFAVMFDPADVKPKIEREIKTEGKDEKALLYNWLEELLYLLDTEGFLLSRVKKITIKGKVLEAVVAGDLVANGYKTHGDVKAVTYNEMDIKKEKDKVIAQVVVDI